MQPKSNDGALRALCLSLNLIAGISLCGCGEDQPSGWTPPPDLASADVVKGIPQNLPDLPPFYTDEQCTAVRRSFPGWAALPSLPETDAKNRPTLWYAIIQITARGQVEDLATVGVDVMSMPLIVDETTDPQATGQSGVMTKSTCSNAELHWAVIPGLTYNTIKEQTLLLKEELVESIILLPVPDDFADLSTTGPGGIHPLSYEVLGQGGYRFMGRTLPETSPSQSGGLSAADDVDTKRGALFGWLKKKIVAAVVNVVNKVPELAERGLAEIDKAFNSTVNLVVRVDVRNTDTTFGGDMGDVPGGPKDQSTPIVRGWGPTAGAQLDLAGVTVAATQITLSINGRGLRTRVEDDVDSANLARLSIVKNKRTGLCLQTETSAVEMTDFLNEMEVCDFQQKLIGPSGAPFGDNTFNTSTSMVVRIQNKYFNILAQMNDSQKFSRDVYHYDPHKATLLTGRMANFLTPLHADRLVTPCLDFPNLGVDLTRALSPLSCVGGAFSSASGAACPVSVINAALGVYEVDMWMPTNGLAEKERRLEDRQISTHEFGHFLMCSLLFDADWKKMRQVPNLILQRMIDGSYMSADNESAIVMESWADYFASQLTGGTNYFAAENSVQSNNGLVDYCEGKSNSCLDLNYVEDNDNTDDGSGKQSVGFRSQIRQTVSILTDAFDGRPFGLNEPNSADLMSRNPSLNPPVVLSAVHGGDAHDEPVVLPGTALRTVVNRWVEMHDVPRWKVNRQQFHSAITTTILENKSSWCDACRVYAPHDGKSCAFAPGAIQHTGECRDPGTLMSIAATMTMSQMVGICTQPPIASWVGPAPAATDPATDCTFTGCAPHKRLVGTPGSRSPVPSCEECGARQISAGVVPCATCAAADVTAATCTDCPATQVVGGADKNTCVDCAADSAPNGTATCQPCGVRSVPKNGVCTPCADNEIETAEHTCVACPAATPFRMDNTCVASCDCTSAAKPCFVPRANVCVKATCPARQISSGNSCVSCPSGTISVNGTACVACESSVNQFQSDNQCVACPPRSIAVPAAAPTACQLCPRGSVPLAAQCFACRVDQVSGDDNSCHSCPAGQIPLNDVCIPIEECSSTSEHCGRRVDPRGFCSVVVC
jgi:hypothetical protein